MTKARGQSDPEAETRNLIDPELAAIAGIADHDEQRQAMFGYLNAKLKEAVPEEARATIYNLYRVPLNCVVLGVLLNDLAITTAFGACCAMLLVAAVAMHVLSSAPAKHTKPMSGGDGAEGASRTLVQPDRDVSGDARARLREDTGRSLLGGVLDVGGAVSASTRERAEEVPRLNRAAV